MVYEHLYNGFWVDVIYKMFVGFPKLSVLWVNTIKDIGLHLGCSVIGIRIKNH